MQNNLAKFVRYLFLLRQEVHRKLGRASVIFPLISMIWGITSAISLTRDYAHSSFLVASVAGLLLASVFLKLWANGLAQHFAKRFGTTNSEVVFDFNNIDFKNFSFWKELASRPQMIEGVVLQGTLYCVQYILMFCIPLLYVAESWGTLAVSMVIAATTLWDDWWEKLAYKSWYSALIRGVSAVLATSFSFAVLWPKSLSFFYPVIACATILAVMPWGALSPRRRPHKREIAIVLVVIISIVVQIYLGEWIRVPLLSVWIRRPGIGLEIQGRNLREKWPRHLSRRRIQSAQDSKRPICCITPVVSPSGIVAQVSHLWLINGEPIDKIPLGHIRSSDKTEFSPFRTHSCKQHLPPAESIQTIECRVIFDGTLDIGGVELTVQDQESKSNEE